MFRCPTTWLLVPAVAVLPFSTARAGDRNPDWNKQTAAKYLDARGEEWFGFAGADRSTGATKTSCISCHTLLPFALSRPVLRKSMSVAEPTKYEQKLLAQTKERVNAWPKLDTPGYRLFYDSSDRKKKESWGTEAVLNALVLSFNDRSEGRTNPSAVTKEAFTHLWQTQAADGPQPGSWDWLDFGLQPWEAKPARYYGAALAAVAVGTAPGYYTPGADAAVDAKVKLLGKYLKGNLAAQNLFNRVYALWAASQLDGVLADDERRAIVAELFAKQQDDGGWSLPSLGKFVRSDRTPQETASDGYATGLVVHVLQTAGIGKDHPKVAKGLGWLRANQMETGEWRTSSLNKKRNPATHVGKFMTDAATGFAVLALGH